MRVCDRSRIIMEQSKIQIKEGHYQRAHQQRQVAPDMPDLRPDTILQHQKQRQHEQQPQCEKKLSFKHKNIQRTSLSATMIASRNASPKSPPNSPTASPSRRRTLLTREQVSMLRRMMDETAFPNRTQREQLSKQLGISEKSIQIWFQNQRQKHKIQMRKLAAVGLNPYVGLGYYTTGAGAMGETNISLNGATLSTTSTARIGGKVPLAAKPSYLDVQSSIPLLANASIINGAHQQQQSMHKGGTAYLYSTASPTQTLSPLSPIDGQSQLIETTLHQNTATSNKVLSTLDTDATDPYSLNSPIDLFDYYSNIAYGQPSVGLNFDSWW